MGHTQPSPRPAEASKVPARGPTGTGSCGAHPATGPTAAAGGALAWALPSAFNTPEKRLPVSSPWTPSGKRQLSVGLYREVRGKPTSRPKAASPGERHVQGPVGRHAVVWRERVKSEPANPEMRPDSQH